jgi:2'-hydroxyisoflavone reductase
MLAPGTPKDPVQIIDVRDLAAWILLLSERRTRGVFNAISAPGAITMGDVVRASLAASPAAHTRVTWVAEDYLPAAWIQDRRALLPWRPRHGASAGEPFTATDRAVKAGLRIRPLAQTVRDTWSWYQTLSPEASHRRPGMDPATEAELLRSWHTSREPAGRV